MLAATARTVHRPQAGENTESGLVRILTLPIWRLRPAPENEQLYRPVSPGDPDVRALAESIRQHGVRQGAADPAPLVGLRLRWRGDRLTRENILHKAHGIQVVDRMIGNTDHGDSDGDDEDGIGSKDDLIRSLADIICGTNHFAQDAGQRLYYFADGVYRPSGAEVVRRAVKRLCIEFEVTAEWSRSRMTL